MGSSSSFHFGKGSFSGISLIRCIIALQGHTISQQKLFIPYGQKNAMTQV